MAISITTPLTRLLDSPPYNRVDLTCKSSTRVRVQSIPFRVRFTWYTSVHGGPLREILPVLGSVGYGSVVTGNVSVHVGEKGAHMFLCRIFLDVRPSPDTIMNERNVIVDVYGEFMIDS